MIGRQFGDWTATELIDDTSGNGVVWKAINSTQTEAAVKVLRPFANPKQAEKRRRRFANEIKKLQLALSLEDVSGVMPILCEGLDDPTDPWFAMPLAEKLTPTADRLQWAIATMTDVSKTIAALHGQGIVHRDIKPNNLLVLDGVVVVSDFGLAHTVDDETITQTGEAVGSFGYTAPESVGHSDEPQFKRDVYALGKTTWVLVSGRARPPAHELSVGDSLEGLGVASTTVDITLLDELLRSSTDRDPGSRPTARQFYEGLIACIPETLSNVSSASGSPAVRAASLFGNLAASNRRDNETSRAYRRICDKVGKKFENAWRDVRQAFGWPSFSHGGGGSQNAAPGWTGRYCWSHRGPIGDEEYAIALRVMRLKPNGELRLKCRLTISVEHLVWPSTEHIIATTEIDSFVRGPDFQRKEQMLLDFVENKETQFRAIELLKQLTKSSPDASRSS